MIATAGMWKLKTYINLYIIFFAFIIGLFLNWILVPNFGIQGASIATAITFFIWSITSIIISEKLWSFYFNVSKFIIQTLLASSYVVFSLIYKNLVSFNAYVLITLMFTIFLALSSFNYRDLLLKFKKKVLEDKY